MNKEETYQTIFSSAKLLRYISGKHIPVTYGPKVKNIYWRSSSFLGIQSHQNYPYLTILHKANLSTDMS